LKLLNENIGKTLQDISIGDDFLNDTPIARIDKYDCIKLEIFCTSKETIASVKDSLQNGRKCLPAIHLTVEYYPEYIKSSKNK
jgi:hypothetical protein